MNLTIGIVEDEKNIREGIALLVDASEGFECKHTFDSAEEAMQKIPLLI